MATAYEILKRAGVFGLPGVARRAPARGRRGSGLRTARCWSCGADLSRFTHEECRWCRWLVCDCGACAKPGLRRCDGCEIGVRYGSRPAGGRR